MGELKDWTPTTVGEHEPGMEYGHMVPRQEHSWNGGGASWSTEFTTHCTACGAMSTRSAEYPGYAGQWWLSGQNVTACCPGPALAHPTDTEEKP